MMRSLVTIATLLLLQGALCQQIKNMQIVNTGTSYVDLSWGKVNDATIYTIVWYEAPQNNWASKIENIATTKYRLTDLKSGTYYGAYVEITPGGTSAVATFQTLGPKPVSNFNIDHIGARQVTVSWVPNAEQAYDGFTVVLFRSYSRDNQTEVKRDELGKDIRRHIVDGLLPGTGYQVGVFGYTKNEKGQDSFSTTESTGFGSALELLAPTNLRESNRDLTHATLNWNTPAGDTTVTHYEVEYRELADQAQVISVETTNGGPTSLKVQGLKPGTVYVARVRAVAVTISNTLKGDWSDWFSFETREEADLPRPLNIKKVGSINTDNAVVQWDAVTGNVDHYEVMYHVINTRPTTPVETKQTTYHMVDLRSGTDYSVFITAISTSGKRGATSTAFNFITPGPLPVASNPVITEITTNSARLTWVPLSGSTHDTFLIKLYSVQENLRTLVKTYPAKKEDRSLEFKSLESNTGYAVEIYTKTTATNEQSSPVKHGFRTALEKTISTHRLTCTHQVPTSKEQIGTVTLTCDRIANVVTIRYETRIVVKDSPSLSRNKFKGIQQHGAVSNIITLTGLLTGYSYEVYVRPVFAGEINGTESTAFQFNIPMGRPPTFMDITKITDTQGVLSWLDPYTDNIQRNFEYVISYKSLEDKQVTQKQLTIAHNQPRQYVIPELEANHRYEVAISTKLSGDAHNGTTLLKAFRTRLPRPQGPAYPDIKIETDMVFEWQLIPARPDINKYEIYIDREDGREMVTMDGAKTAHYYNIYTSGALVNLIKLPLKNFDKGVTYQGKVRAIVTNNDEEKKWLKNGLWSTVNHFIIPDGSNPTQTFDRNSLQTQINSKTDTAINIQWKRRDNVLHYEIQVTAQLSDITGEQIEYVVTTPGTHSQVTVNNLTPGMNYFYRIRAVGVNNEKSLWSPRNTFTTQGSSSGSSSSGLSDGVVAGIIVAVLLIFVILVIGVIIMQRRRKAHFNRFGNSVQFTRNEEGQANGGHTEMEDPAQTAIKKGNKLYV